MTQFTNMNANFDFQNKVALVTGGAGHLGREFGEALANCGATVISLDTRELGNQSEHKGQIIERVCDLSDDTAIADVIKYCDDTFGKIDILVNNAAFVGTSNLGGWAVPFEKQSLDTWRRALDVNLTAVFALCQMAWPLMKKTTNASIINISSIYGILGPDNDLYEGTEMGNPAAYAASKGGVIQLTRWLATNMAPTVRVNALALGGIERGQPEKFQAKYNARTPMGRMGTEKDMVGPMLFLASEMSGYVTGQTLPVDGGWSVW